MRDIASMNLPARQRGAALLILLGLFSVILIYAVVVGLNRSAVDMAQERAQKTSTALAQAKEALIAYAVTYGDDFSNAQPVPGFLPCPETVPTPNLEGVAAGTTADCGSALVSKLGRLPWRTLGLGPVTDGSGECLWYAVSGTYKNLSRVTTVTTTSNVMNWDTNGQFNVMAADGTTYLVGAPPAVSTDTRAVAVIFAPGRPLSGQDRTPNANARACGGNYNATAYLDQVTVAGMPFNNGAVSTNAYLNANANAINTFIAGDNSSTFNDRLVYITRAEIWNAIKKRSDFQNHLRALTRRAAECIAMYGTQNQNTLDTNIDATDKRMPWASNVLLSATSLVIYAVDARYRDNALNLRSGRLPYRLSVSAISSATGTKNSIASPYHLLDNASYCSYYSVSPFNEQAWYDHWKDHLFYAIANNYRPAAGNKPTGPCGTCLQINGGGNYAAVVIFAGEKLSGLPTPQRRNTAAEKGSSANYLEDQNLTQITANSGSGSYKAASSSSTFNDIVYAIDTNLRVQCYSPSPPPGGAMVLQNSTPQTGIAASAPAPLSPPGAPNLPPGPVEPYAACP
jgi:Tfp pilus assembly protein PilX